MASSHFIVHVGGIGESAPYHFNIQGNYFVLSGPDIKAPFSYNVYAITQDNNGETSLVPLQNADKDENSLLYVLDTKLSVEYIAFVDHNNLLSTSPLARKKKEIVIVDLTSDYEAINNDRVEPQKWSIEEVINCDFPGVKTNTGKHQMTPPKFSIIKLALDPNMRSPKLRKMVASSTWERVNEIPCRYNGNVVFELPVQANSKITSMEGMEQAIDGHVSDCIEDSVFRFVVVFAIVLAGLGLRRVFAFRLPNMAARTSEFELFVTRFDESNFAWWSSHMLDALTCLDQALPVQGKDARPKSMSDSAWEDLDAIAWLTIMLSLVESVYCIVMHACTTRDGLCPSVGSSVARQESSDSETMTCVDDKHDDALRSFTDMPLPMSDGLSHGTSCVDVIARETDVCEPCMAMLINTESVDEPDFWEPEMNVLFYDGSDMFEDDSVL
ncbi:hypothetical protein L7F22_036237 [Adiantum nelumboides]|nr:hypothetical protein [Adiantum nelumboides]